MRLVVGEETNPVCYPSEFRVEPFLQVWNRRDVGRHPYLALNQSIAPTPFDWSVATAGCGQENVSIVMKVPRTEPYSEVPRQGTRLDTFTLLPAMDSLDAVNYFAR